MGLIHVSKSFLFMEISYGILQISLQLSHGYRSDLVFSILAVSKACSCILGWKFGLNFNFPCIACHNFHKLVISIIFLGEVEEISRICFLTSVE